MLRIRDRLQAIEATGRPPSPASMGLGTRDGDALVMPISNRIALNSRRAPMRPRPIDDIEFVKRDTRRLSSLALNHFNKAIGRQCQTDHSHGCSPQQSGFWKTSMKRHSPRSNAPSSTGRRDLRSLSRWPREILRASLG